MAIFNSYVTLPEGIFHLTDKTDTGPYPYSSTNHAVQVFEQRFVVATVFINSRLVVLSQQYPAANSMAAMKDSLSLYIF